MKTKELLAAVKAAKVGKYIYTVIERHPLRDCYMLYSPVMHWIPPFFGTLRECKQVQPMAEARFKMEVEARHEKKM